MAETDRTTATARKQQQVDEEEKECKTERQLCKSEKKRCIKKLESEGASSRSAEKECEKKEEQEICYHLKYYIDEDIITTEL